MPWVLSLDVISGGVCEGACQQMMLESDLLMRWSRLFKWADITQPMEGLGRAVEGGLYPVFLPTCLIDVYLLLVCSCSSQAFKLRLASPLQHSWVSSSQSLAPTEHHWSYDPVVDNLSRLPDFPLLTLLIYFSEEPWLNTNNPAVLFQGLYTWNQKRGLKVITCMFIMSVTVLLTLVKGAEVTQVSIGGWMNKKSARNIEITIT